MSMKREHYDVSASVSADNQNATIKVKVSAKTTITLVLGLDDDMVDADSKDVENLVAGSDFENILEQAMDALVAKFAEEQA